MCSKFINNSRFFSIQAELDRNTIESRNLTETKKELKKALCETEGPLRITTECIYKRKRRTVYNNFENNLIYIYI